MLDILAAKQLIERASMLAAWVPTWGRQFADSLTQGMPDELFREFKSKGTICLKETLEDQEKELYRAGLRRGQRERGKARMLKAKKTLSPTSLFLDVIDSWKVA